MTNDITPCLWFNDNAEQASELYLKLFPNSQVKNVAHYSDDPATLGPNAERAGQVLMLEVELDGKPFTLLNGGPMFPQTAAVSFQVYCDSQEEVDHYWYGLIADGGAERMCGWCKDRFGVNWQIIPRRLMELMSNPDAASQVAAEMYKQSRLVIADLEAAAGL